MNSFNHYAFGAVGEWLYSVVAGIDVDESRPGFRNAIIRPRPGGGLTWARGSLDTPYGRIESHWRLEAGRFLLDVTVPPNATATVYLPASAKAGASVGDVTESGKPLSAAEGISDIRAEAGEVVCRVTAGEYRFAVKA